MGAFILKTHSLQDVWLQRCETELSQAKLSCFSFSVRLKATELFLNVVQDSERQLQLPRQNQFLQTPALTDFMLGVTVHTLTFVAGFFLSCDRKLLRLKAFNLKNFCKGD